MMYLTTLLIVLPLVAITAFTPYITRKTESFGVTIPSDLYKHERIVSYRKQYAKYSLVIGLIYILLLFALSFSVSETIWIVIFTVGVFVYLIVTFLIYLHFHKKMKQLKEKEKWFEKRKQTVAVDLTFYNEKKTYSNWWFTIPFLIVVAVTAWSYLNYDLIPDQIPMQYNFEGEVTRSIEKSPIALISLPLVQLFLIGVFVFTNIIIGRSKQQVDPANPEKSAKQNLIFRRRWSLFTIIGSILLTIVMALPQLSFVLNLNQNMLMIIIMVIVGLIVIGAFLLTIFTGQGGSRVGGSGANIIIGKSGEKINRDDDKYWKLGIFYFNPEDPANWVEKRFGSGWTGNFGRPLPWIFIILVILIPILIAKFTS